MNIDDLRAMNCTACKSVGEAAKFGKRDWWMEPKLDGFRLVARISDDTTPGNCVATYTRSLKRQDGKVPAIENELLAIFPPGTVVDGEICSLKADGQGNDFEHVQSVMLSQPETAARKFAERPLQYLLFDITFYKGSDIRSWPLRDRRELLESLVDQNPQTFVGMNLRLAPTQENHDALVSAGFEGSVLKDASGVYASGDRNKSWLKIKAQPEVDVIVMGYQPGRGKFEGLVGAVEFGQPDDSGLLVKRGQCSGMDDEQRKYMTEHMDELLGTVITIKPFGTLGKGLKFRMPQFDRFRPDKPASEVIWHNG